MNRRFHIFLNILCKSEMETVDYLVIYYYEETGRREVGLL